MRNKFDQELLELSDAMTDMGALNEKAMEWIITIFDGKAAVNIEEVRNRVKELEVRVDDLEAQIRGQAMRLLASQQPVARDLRSISTALHIITDMERIADQAYDIAEIAMFFRGSEMRHRPRHLVEMIEQCIIMVRKSVDAYVAQDMDTARRVIEADDRVDSLFLLVREELIDAISRDRETGKEAMDFIMIAKYFERIADHAVNVAEWVIFNITGERVKDPGALGGNEAQ